MKKEPVYRRRARPVVRTMETAARKRQQPDDQKEGEAIHNGSADAFQDAEGIPVDRDSDEGDRGEADDNY